MSDDSRLNYPSVAIVIPTCRRPEPLKLCLRQILPYVSLHPECMIVISDDGSAEETKAALGEEFRGVKLVQGPRRGAAANRNCGAANSTGDLIVFFDDDCRPDHNVIAAYQRAASLNPECGVFEGRITAVGESTSFAETSPANETGGHLWSCNFAIRRELFNAVGGFDNRYAQLVLEDIDLHFRLAAQSPIRFIPEARVYHAIEIRKEFKRLRHYALGHLLFLHLHGLKATQHGPKFFMHLVARMTIDGSRRLIKRQAARDPQFLLALIWVNAELLFITLFWRVHPYLARILFPPCCPGCRSVHASLNAGR